MRTRTHVTVIVLLASVCLTTNRAFGPDISEANQQSVISDTSRLAVDFKATNLNGKPFSGLPLKGKIVLLDFWAVWCKPCIAAFPILKKLNRDFKDKSFEVVGVAVYSGGPKDVNDFLQKHKLDYKIVVGDADLAIRFGVIGFPSYFLIGPDGKIHTKYVGEEKDLYSDVKNEILKLNRQSQNKRQMQERD